jgi:hypothetical protein
VGHGPRAQRTGKVVIAAAQGDENAAWPERLRRLRRPDRYQQFRSGDDIVTTGDAGPGFNVGVIRETRIAPRLSLGQNDRLDGKAPDIVRNHGNATLARSLFTEHANLEQMRVDGGHDASPLLAPAAGHRIGYEREGCSRAIDVVLHRGRPAQPDRPDNFSVHLNGNPPYGLCMRLNIPAESHASGAARGSL